MKKRIITATAAIVLGATVFVYTAISGENEHNVFANIITETSESGDEVETDTTASDEISSEEDDVIVIPDDAQRYGAITINNIASSAVSVTCENGSVYQVSGESQVDYSDPLLITGLNGDIDLEISGSNFYYGIKGSSIESISINPQNGIVLSGTDYNYDISVGLASSNQNLEFSGNYNGELSIVKEASALSASGVSAVGNICVAVGSKELKYQLNATKCTLKSDGSVFLADGTQASTVSDSVSSLEIDDLAENVFHTIEPALLVHGGSSTLAKAKAYINDYVYDEDTSSSTDTDISSGEYYEYYGEKGNLAFTITIYSGNHARIHTSDGEVHDYIIEAQEGAHCYPVFSF